MHNASTRITLSVPIMWQVALCVPGAGCQYLSLCDGLVTYHKVRSSLDSFIIFPSLRTLPDLALLPPLSPPDPCRLWLSA